MNFGNLATVLCVIGASGAIIIGAAFGFYLIACAAYIANDIEAMNEKDGPR